MQAADVGDLTRLLHHGTPALALGEVARLDSRGLRGHAVRHEVAVGPGDAVPGGDFEPLRDELHPFDADLMRLGRYFFPREACRCLACSRCAAIAGRTLVMRPFSSAFCALGISSLSIASSTCWW